MGVLTQEPVERHVERLTSAPIGEPTDLRSNGKAYFQRRREVTEARMRSCPPSPGAGEQGRAGEPVTLFILQPIVHGNARDLAEQFLLEPLPVGIDIHDGHLI